MDAQLILWRKISEFADNNVLFVLGKCECLTVFLRTQNILNVDRNIFFFNLLKVVQYVRFIKPPLET